MTVASSFGRGALLRSALIVTGATYVTYVTGLVVSTLIARALGPGDFGRYSYVVWMSGIVMVACTNGLTTTGIKFVAECLGRGDEEGAARVYGLLRRYFLFSVALVAVACLAALPFVTPDGWRLGLPFYVFAVLASSVPKASYLLHSSVAKGHGNFSVEANTTNILSFAGLLATVALVLTGQPLHAYLLLLVALGVGHAVLTRVFIGRTPIRSSGGAIEADMLARLRVHLAWTVVLIFMATVSNRTIETFLLNRHVGAEAVGFFVIAATLTRGGADLLVNGLTAVLIPAMAHSYGRGGADQVSGILSHSVRYFLFLGLMLAGVGVFCAELAVKLMYGDGFSPVVDVFQVMVIVAGLTLSEGAFNALLTTTDRQRARVVLTGTAVGVTAVLAFVLVPRHGLMGAVAAHALARAFMFTIIVATAVWSARVRLPWREIVRLLLAGAIAAAAAWLLARAVPGPWGGVLAAGLYVAVLAAGSLVLRTWKEADLGVLHTLADRFPPMRKVAVFMNRWAQR